MNRRTITYTLIVALMAAVFILTAPAHPADAAVSTTTFPVEYEARPGTVSAGDVILIGSYEVGATNPIVGTVCTFRVTSTNDESVHVNSFAEIITNGSSTLVLGTEDGVNGVHVADSTLELGETIEVWYHVGARALGESPTGVSVELEVSFTCTTDGTTTTTTAPSTTTTTPAGSTTSTTTGSTTSSSSTSSTTTSIPPAPPTTAPTGSTTTTHHDPVTPPTEPPGSSTVPPVSTPDPTLPFTGPEDMGGWAMVGGALLLLGAGIVYGLRQTEKSA